MKPSKNELKAIGKVLEHLAELDEEMEPDDAAQLVWAAVAERIQRRYKFVIVGQEKPRKRELAWQPGEPDKEGKRKPAKPVSLQEAPEAPVRTCQSYSPTRAHGPYATASETAMELKRLGQENPGVRYMPVELFEPDDEVTLKEGGLWL